MLVAGISFNSRRTLEKNFCRIKAPVGRQAMDWQFKFSVKKKIVRAAKHVNGGQHI